MTPGERTLASRLGAFRAWSRHSVEEMNGQARRRAAETLDARLLQEIDPDRALAPEERLRRLHAARRAHFTALSLKAVRARRRGGPGPG
ncbi:MAG: hypothetical protein ACLQHS_01855 [Candidatus Limnocylindrales bacterium]